MMRAITPTEAEALLPEGADRIHCTTGGPMFIGCEWDRSEVIDALRLAQEIRVSGPVIGHALAVRLVNGRMRYFDIDAAKVETLKREVAA